MDQLPVDVGQPRGFVGQVRPGAQAARLDRIVVEKILGHAAAQTPAPGNVRADGDDGNFSLPARSGNFADRRVRVGFADAVQNGLSGTGQPRERRIDGQGSGLHGCPVCAGVNEDDIASHAILPDLFGVTSGAAVRAIHLQPQAGFARTAHRINVGRIENGGLLRPAELQLAARAQIHTTNRRAR